MTWTKPHTFEGRGPVTYTEIKAYSDLMGLSLTAWEVSALVMLDRAWAKVMLTSDEPTSTS